jgi:ABC-type branched-subunit amino acid transport system substrate-binding protein
LDSSQISSPLAGSRLNRRSALRHLAGSAAATLAFPTAVLAQGRSLRIAAVFANSGPEQVNGAGLFQGSSAFFAALNRAGGVHGAKVELVMADDQFDPDLAKQHAQAFQADPTVLAFVHPLGTRQVAAVMDAAKDMAIVGPNTGTVALRKKPAPNTFWVRANYDQEVEKLISTAVTLGTTKIALAHPKDPLGAGLLAAFNASCERHKVTPAIIATTPSTISPEVDPAAQAIAKAEPQVVVMGLGAGTAPLFVRALRQAGSPSTIYGLSIAMSAPNIRELGALSRGLGFSIVVPSPFATRYEIVRRYQADMAASGSNDFSLPSLEGYVDARVLAEGLRRAGPAPTRAGLIAALEQLESLELGGLRIGYGKATREGSRFVDVAVIGSDGRIMS